MAIPAGRDDYLGPYNLLRKIGAGGMGEIHLAEDSRLDRKVAIKLLPAEFTLDVDRVRRFEREAKAASALNHPNIITIYEIGEANGTHYIVTEYIQGKTLRERMAESLTLETALDVATQMASALRAAHEVGIVHRDIKPENVMLRPDGLVKVLDFGIAKLIERPSAPQSPPVDADQETVALNDPYANKVDPYKSTADPLNETATGVIMGTVTYMSPEQLRGQKVDARADIFSLGVVLYEVIAGRSPFAGSTQADRIAAILEREPEPLSDYRSDVPRDLERIVTRALRKDRDARYQLVEEILVELNELKQELEIQKKLGRSTHPELRDPATKNLEAGLLFGLGDSATTSSTRIILSEIKRHRRGALLIVAAFIAGTIALGYFGYSFYTGGSTARITSLAVLPFTNTGNAPNLEYL
ncbi:MAG TPA: serine/threonine-protein kinase, partial [Pyrinomonadaceae bacterium]|nr:serine/threonine-protein kinase [Pyrinomonadaceae bacterium]